MVIVFVVKKTCTLTIWYKRSLESFHLLRKCFFFVFVTFTYVARTTPNTSPGKLTKLRTIKKKIENIEIFKIFCFILKIFVRHTFLHTFYTLWKSYSF